MYVPYIPSPLLSFAYLSSCLLYPFSLPLTLPHPQITSEMVEQFTSMVTLSRTAAVALGASTEIPNSSTPLLSFLESNGLSSGGSNNGGSGGSNNNVSSGEVNNVGTNTALTDLAVYCAYNFPGEKKRGGEGGERRSEKGG